MPRLFLSWPSLLATTAVCEELSASSTPTNPFKLGLQALPPPNNQNQLLSKVKLERLVGDIWDLISQSLQVVDASRVDRHYVEVPYRSLRRASSMRYHAERRGQSTLFIYANLDRIDAFAPADAAQFEEAMNIVVKAFADQRLNADLVYRASSCGEREARVLRLTWQDEEAAAAVPSRNSRSDMKGWRCVHFAITNLTVGAPL